MKLKKLFNKKLLGVVLSLTLGISAVGCSTKSNVSSKNDKTIAVGAMQVPGTELFEHLKSEVEKEGYELEIVTFNDYTTPNTALADSEIDANLFQHRPYLNESIEKQGYDLTDVVRLYEVPLQAYSNKIKSFDELKSGDKFAIPNDPTNGSRALKILEDEGVIKLKEGVELSSAKDIIENKRNIEFIEADASQLPSLLQDVDAAFINGNFAAAAGLDANKQSIYSPEIDGTYENVLACRTEDLNSEKIEILKKILTSDESRSFLKEHYKGIIIPTF
ncbi:MetQ/NlpA family ABC transporter substrate-binding protein [Romboutsia sp. Marseille-P6047]|uniref:MetQ/NlpA family ABC transporter substrate-binding protein n=1 Tax=Romboutsia sp. Marseille-P6047 TaxID=2161817 RepID=UPI000F04D2D2|nr:MetQ/NlpA family ABC transporter substrate-binding protein [Romboutsia sp. Marseille-P6047]